MTAKDLKKGDEFRLQKGSVFRIAKLVDIMKNTEGIKKEHHGKVYVIYGKCKELLLNPEQIVILR